ncbi:CAP domain-containing protein [Nocardia brasiliensis]|uniref:CAP domain-containing protein n=1 Tax=Nocardia brasiliensis TaxID=37326 RepID=UPI0004A6DC37|nr:CAP domain-containing protein [Nocardia brasiliensis]
MKYRIITALGLAAASSVVLTACPGTSSVPGTNLLDLINQKRAAHSCNPVSGDDQLRVAAERHAVDIREHPDHYGPPGTDPPRNDIHTGTDNSDGGARIAAAGYAPLIRWGEIIYWAGGPPGNTPQATIDWWMQSDDHREQIETCEYTHAGIGLLYPGGTKWIAVVNFASH